MRIVGISLQIHHPQSIGDKEMCIKSKVEVRVERLIIKVTLSQWNKTRFVSQVWSLLQVYYLQLCSLFNAHCICKIHEMRCLFMQILPRTFVVIVIQNNSFDVLFWLNNSFDVLLWQ